MTMKRKHAGILENENISETDLAFFSFRESLRARWKEIKHSYSLLSKSPLFFIGLFIIIVLVILAFLAPYIAPYKCYNIGNCDNQYDPITQRVYFALPPMTKDLRVVNIYWTSFVHQQSGFSDLSSAGKSYIAQIPGPNNTVTNKLLVGTSDSRLLLYNISYPSNGGNLTFTQISNATYPLPAVPSGLTTVIPAMGDINNDSTFDLVLGGNTGLIYLSLNNGTNANPVWLPWMILKDKWTGTPIQFNGTSSPTLIDWDQSKDSLLGGGIDLMITSSGDNQVHFYLQRPAAFAFSDYSRSPTFYPNHTLTADCSQGPQHISCWDDASYNFTKVVDTTFNNNTIFFQSTPNLIYQINQQNKFYFNVSSYGYNPGTGVFRIHFAYMDPVSPTTKDMLVTFGNGVTYVFVLGGSVQLRFITLLDKTSESPLFRVPPLKNIPSGSDVIINDLNNDTYADMIILAPNGSVQLAYQHGVIDGRTHFLGTDDIGGDIFSKILYSLQYDLIWAIIIEGLTVILGVIIGAISGYFGGFIDMLFMRITDIFFAFPDLILAMAITAALGASMINVAIALIIVDWSGTARLMRGQVLAERSRLYVEAARSTGNSNFRIIFRHVLPNSIYPIIVTATLGIGGVILSFSGLSFLGFGPGQGSAELGVMITDARTFVTTDPGMIFFPGIVIVVIVLAFNLLGDALRDILDPRFRR